MATPDKDTDKKPLEEFYLGKGTIEFMPFNIPKGGTPLGDLSNHWIKLNPARSFHVECNPDIKCPICEMLRPKTKWEKIKLWLKKLVKNVKTV